MANLTTLAPLALSALLYCTDYLNTSVPIESFYLAEPCLKCECLIFDGIESSLCTHLTHTCPCDSTPCCIDQCEDQPDHSNGTGGTITSNSGTVRTALLAAAAVLIIALCITFLGCYYYRQSTLSDVRNTRRLWLDRMESVKPGASAPIEPPPSYNEIETDGCLLDLPPAYNEVVQCSPSASFSFAALLRRDSLGTTTSETTSQPSVPALI